MAILFGPLLNSFNICILFFSLLLFYFLYKIYLIRKINMYCEKLKISSINKIIYVYESENIIGYSLFRYFLMPCIKKCTYHPTLNGYVLTKNQYECLRKYIKCNIYVGIGCYSKMSVNSKINFFNDAFSFSVAIREVQLFKSDEKEYISALAKHYLSVLTLNNFHQLNYSFEVQAFFSKLEYNAIYIHNIKNERNRLKKINILTKISKFDQYLFYVCDKLECELNRYNAFNLLLKAYEAIIHYICSYYLVKQKINLDSSFEHYKVIDAVENGGLGTWLELTYKILKYTDSLENSWLLYTINETLWNSFSAISYNSYNLNQNKSVYNKVSKSKESYFNFLSNRLVNLRNNTIGHGSSSYIPIDEDIWHMYRIYLILLIEIKTNLSDIDFDVNNYWVKIEEDNVYFLDKLNVDIHELRYVDYASEKLKFTLFEKESL